MDKSTLKSTRYCPLVIFRVSPILLGLFQGMTVGFFPVWQDHGIHDSTTLEWWDRWQQNESITRTGSWRTRTSPSKDGKCQTRWDAQIDGIWWNEKKASMNYENFWKWYFIILILRFIHLSNCIFENSILHLCSMTWYDSFVTCPNSRADAYVSGL